MQEGLVVLKEVLVVTLVNSAVEIQEAQVNAVQIHKDVVELLEISTALILQVIHAALLDKPALIQLPVADRTVVKVDKSAVETVFALHQLHISA